MLILPRFIRGKSPLVVLALWVAACGGCKNLEQPAGDQVPPPTLPPAVSSQKRQAVDVSRLQVGDQLELFVKEDSSFNGVLKVRERGDVIIPAIGRVTVAGMTIDQAQGAIESALEASQLRQATVILDRVAVAAGPKLFDPLNPEATARTILVYMTGKVNRPGQHVLTLPKDRTLGVYEAILIAGGINRFGDDQKTHVLRSGKDGTRYRVPVNIRLIEQGKQKDPPIGHGDIVVVPERVFGF